MHGLQVLRHQVCVSPRHLKGAMAQTLLQVEHRPASPEIVDREGVPECVQCACRRSESEMLAQQLHNL
jgi:hypothetical protein